MSLSDGGTTRRGSGDVSEQTSEICRKDSLGLVRACVDGKYFFKTQNRHKNELRDVALHKNSNELLIF